MVTGDVDGDDIDEIVYSDARTSHISIYDSGIVTDTGLEGWDMITGDVDGDNIKEIIFTFRNNISTYDFSLYYFYFTIDTTPPEITNMNVYPKSGTPSTLFTITSNVFDVSGVASVMAHIQYPDEMNIATVTLYDDGLHSDGIANDGIYGNRWDSIDNSIGTYYVDIIAVDTLNNSGEADNAATFSLVLTNIINVKDITKYYNKHVFLISDEDWHNVLSAVPLTIWTNGSFTFKFPLLVYHKEGSSFDADSIIHFMQLYKPENVTIIGNSPAALDNLLIAASPTGVGLNSNQINRINPSDYFSYWETINSLVVVDFNNYRSGLLASVFASFKNLPILFVNSANLNIYENLIDGKEVYTVDSLEPVVSNFIAINASSVKNYNFVDLQKEYINMTRTDKVILVNPNDTIIYLSSSFTPEKSGSPISRIFGNHSLIAPILASAKRELIIFSDIPGSPENTGCNNDAQITNNVQFTDNYVVNNITFLFTYTPEYLTIIASPKAIPDSLYDGCYGSYQFREAVDWKYGSFDDSKYHIMVGRIYGLTTSDSSSYIARTIFYDLLVNNIYGNNNYTGMSIGHSFSCDENGAHDIKVATSNSGYSSLCFIESTSYPADCTADASPATSFYKGRQFITFADHGSPTSWGGTISSTSLPWLDLPYSFGHACLTNNYWQGGRIVFGSYFLRRGGIGYHGSTGVTYLSCGAELNAMKKLTGFNRISLGELHKSLYGFVRAHYIILGDPTLKPIFKEVLW